MIIPEYEQNLAKLKAFYIQWSNGYHLSEKDVKEFKDGMEFFKKCETLFNGKNATL